MKLQGDWLTHPGTVRVMAALARAGCGAWFVGGCVRNTLLGTTVDDIDIATDARPERTMDLFEAAGLKTVPTGLEHGTVTVIADGKPHEITTLRRDVETDGRRAIVAFSDHIEEDARRRDFTINALYATADGMVLDPLGKGLEDLAARRVRFIGQPQDRIREDHLRILRFFRFHAWYADPANGLDRDALAACAEMADGIDRLSKERVGAEMKKLLSAPDPAMAVAAMDHAGILSRILPGAQSTLLIVLTGLEGDHPPQAMRRLAALCGEGAATALRLSRAESKCLTTLREGLEGTTGAAEIAYRHGAETARDIVLLRAALAEQPPEASAFEAVDQGAAARFPVTASDLMPALEGPALGRRLSELEARWIASGFTLTRDDLLSETG